METTNTPQDPRQESEPEFAGVTKAYFIFVLVAAVLNFFVQSMEHEYDYIAITFSVAIFIDILFIYKERSKIAVIIFFVLQFISCFLFFRIAGFSMESIIQNIIPIALMCAFLSFTRDGKSGWKILK